ncbi:MAG: PP2C family protein-serine/threonine phosphatase [Acidobacteriota bacterium]
MGFAAYGRVGLDEVGELIGGGIIGTCVNAGALLTDWGWFTLLRRRFAAPARWLLQFLTLSLGGTAGYVVGNVVAHLLGYNPTVSLDAQRVVFFGFFAYLVGSLIGLFDRQSRRLAESVALVKDQEFAAKELEVARNLQRRLLPPDRLEGEGWRLEARHAAAHGVAGDLWDTFSSQAGGQTIAIGDVAGKGMAASLIMASVKAVLPLMARSNVDRGLSDLNRRLHGDLGPREFVALALLRYDPANRELELASAGIPDPWLLSRHGVETLAVDGPRLPLGSMKAVEYEAARRTLEPGDRVVLVTDGLPEATGADGEPLGYERLTRLLEERRDDPLEELVESLFQSVGELGVQVDDDWTVVALEAL